MGSFYLNALRSLSALNNIMIKLVPCGASPDTERVRSPLRSNAATLCARETPGWLRSDIVTRRPWTQNRKSSNITCLFEMSVLLSSARGPATSGRAR